MVAMSILATRWSPDRGTVAVGIGVVLTLLVYGTGLVPRPALGVVAWTTVAAVQIVAVRLCFVIAGLPTVGATPRRFYRLLGTATATFVVGSLVQLAVSVRWPGDPRAITGTTPMMLIQGAGAVVLTVAMAASPLGLTGRRERIRFWLDAAVVMVGVGLSAWQLGGFAVRNPSFADLVKMLVGPAAMMVAAFGLVKLALGGNAVFSRGSGVLAAVAAALICVSATTADLAVRTGHPSWSSAAGMLATLMYLAALLLQVRQFRTGAGGARRTDRDPYSRLPYAAVAGSYVLLVWALLDEGLSLRAWVVLGGAMLGSALVVARQLAAFADNDDLLARLNAKVEELAEARDVLQRAVLQRDGLAERLRHLAYHDSLTGLANRTLFRERLSGALAAGETPTVLIIDLNDFKPVNDRYGHHAGDTLLQTVALRLSRCVRDSGTVARLGGDEFGVVLFDGSLPVTDLVERMVAAIALPVQVGTGTGAARAEVRVRASYGWATAEPGEDMSTLLHRADLAMYADKGLSKR
jgi:diguanylate cyclase (GGDEF)-like protein